MPTLTPQDARWPDHCLDIGIFFDWDTWHPNLGLSQDEFYDLFTEALNIWNSKLKVHLYLTDYHHEAKVVAEFATLAGNTLAWSHLADGDCSDDKVQQYDRREWYPQLFKQTVLHEVGHLLGLSHKRGDYVMNPTIITTIYGLTQDDIARARALGYQPRTTDPNQPPTPPVTKNPPPPKPEVPQMNFVEILLALLPLLQNCPKARQQRSKGTRGHLIRAIALRLAARRAGEDWDIVRDHPTAKAFLEFGWDDDDLHAAQQLLQTADADEEPPRRCGNPQ